MNGERNSKNGGFGRHFYAFFLLFPFHVDHVDHVDLEKLSC